MKTFDKQFQNKFNSLIEKLNHLTVIESSQWDTTAFKTSLKSFIKIIILNKSVMRKHDVSESFLNQSAKVHIISLTEIFRTTAHKSHHAFVESDFDSSKLFFINLNFSWNHWVISFLLIYIHSCRLFFKITF